LTALVPEEGTIEVASIAGRRPRVLARRVLSELLQPRAEEVCHLLWDEIRRAGYEASLKSGIVFTGGGAMLEGMTAIAEEIFGLPVRLGEPVGVGGLADHVSTSAFATPVGLVLYTHRQMPVDSLAGVGPVGRLADRIRNIFKEFF
jgi:cell division protein FtsA